VRKVLLVFNNNLLNTRV